MSNPELARRQWAERQWRRLPIVDSHDGAISITRSLAIFFALLCWHAVETQHAVSLNVLWLALASLSAAFGKSTFGFLLTRMGYKGEAKQEDATITENVTITQRRQNGDFEVTP